MTAGRRTWACRPLSPAHPSKVKATGSPQGEDHPPSITFTVNQKMQPMAMNAASEAEGSLLTSASALLSNLEFMEPFLEPLKYVPVGAGGAEDGYVTALGSHREEGGMEGLTPTWHFVCLG